MEAQNPFEYSSNGMNPYGVSPAGVSLMEGQRHDQGNAVAASTEARAVAEVKAQALIARQFPRDPRLSMERILRECERPSLAEKATYTYPRGKETVSGPSIRLAEMMARNWGNCVIGQEVVERKMVRGGVGKSVINTFAWDLETNIRIPKSFEVLHWRATKQGGYALTDDRDIYELEANMGARRLRACILQMLPGDVTQAALDKCKSVVRNGLVSQMAKPETRDPLVRRTIEVFEKIGIPQKELVEYLNGVVANEWTADHMLKLKELKFSLDEGEVKIGDLFPKLAPLGDNEIINDAQRDELMELIKSTGRQREVSDALKVAGFAKVADITAVRLDEMRELIKGFAKGSDAAKALEAPQSEQKAQEPAQGSAPAQESAPSAAPAQMASPAQGTAPTQGTAQAQGAAPAQGAFKGSQRAQTVGSSQGSQKAAGPAHVQDIPLPFGKLEQTVLGRN
mgnify:CR=1 FL=1